MTGTEAEVAIHGIASSGAGVGRLGEGPAIFVHRTAPGDRARVRITQRKKRWARGELLEVQSPGPGRRTAPCPHYDRCGGCTLEHLRYQDQVAWKGRIVQEALARIGDVEMEESPPVEASPSEFRYRSRVTFHLRRSGEGVEAGFFALDDPGTVVDMGGECLLLDPVLARAWTGLRRVWGPGGQRLPAGSRLRLTLRRSGEGAILVVHGGSGVGDPETLVDQVEDLRGVWTERAGEYRHLAGERKVWEEWFGKRYALGPGAFLQVNREAAEALHTSVLRKVGPPRGLRVVDAYCGVGAYGRRLAHHGAKVVGIERDPDAAAGARDRAPDGFRVLNGAVEDHLESVLPAELVILNPPRTGLSEKVVQALVRRRAGRVVYVSCDPATLARDVKRLGPGYRVRVDEVEAHDLFPQTAHVECVLVLDELEGGAPEA